MFHQNNYLPHSGYSDSCTPPSGKTPLKKAPISTIQNPITPSSFFLILVMLGGMDRLLSELRFRSRVAAADADLHSARGLRRGRLRRSWRPRPKGELRRPSLSPVFLPPGIQIQFWVRCNEECSKKPWKHGFIWVMLSHEKNSWAADQRWKNYLVFSDPKDYSFQFVADSADSLNLNAAVLMGYFMHCWLQE